MFVVKTQFIHRICMIGSCNMSVIALFMFVVFQLITGKGSTLKRGDPCITPTNETAKCLPVKECSLILEVIKTRNSSAVEFAQKSQCGYDTEPLVCCGTSATSLSFLNNTAVFPDDICGWHTINRIIGGNTTQLTEFPWLAALEYKTKESKTSVGVKCDGTVISKRHVLTAAHCILTENYDLFRVRLGEHNLTTNPDCEESIGSIFCADPVKEFSIEIETVHPLYNPASHENDIGLLSLHNDIEFTDFIRPICVPGAEMPALEVSERPEISGWNLLRMDARSDTKLRSVVIPLSKEACLTNNSFSGLFPKNQMCAVSRDIKGVCWEGSGGPVIRTYHENYHGTRMYQEGIISWTIECDHLVYTRVAPYKEWIVDSIIKSQSVT